LATITNHTAQSDVVLAMKPKQFLVMSDQAHQQYGRNHFCARELIHFVVSVYKVKRHSSLAALPLYIALEVARASL
jgi:hypothetical protein